MNSEGRLDLPKWYVIYTHSKQEERAESNLQAWGVESFNPKIRECQRNSFTGRSVYSTKSFFQRYIFARFAANELLRKISLTRGVDRVVSFGEGPAPVDDEIINCIKARIGDDGFVRVGDNLELGDTVMINNGPFNNFVGVFDREIKNPNRVMILLANVNFQGHIITQKESIKKLSDHPVAMRASKAVA